MTETDEPRRHFDHSQSWSLTVQAVDHLTQGVSVFDERLNLVMFNDKFVEMLEFPEHLVRLGMPLADLFRYNAERGEYGPGDVEAQVAERVDLAGRFEPHCFERRRPDGLVMEILGRPLPFGGFVTTYTAITERKRIGADLENKVRDRTRELAELNERLRENQQRFKDIAEAASEWFWQMDATLAFTYMSDRFYEVTGLAQDAVIGKLRRELVDVGVRALEPDKWHEHEAALERREAFRDFVYSVDGADGRRRWIKTSGCPYFGEEGEFLGYRGAGSDITELKEAEDLLRQNEEMLRSILDASPAGVAIAKPDDGTIAFANTRMAELTGMPHGDLTGRPFQDYHVDAEEEKLIRSRLESEGLVRDVEIELRRRDGTKFWGLVTMKPVDFGQDKGQLAWVYDITEQKIARERLARLASVDPLTGLANRRVFTETLGMAVKRANRSGRTGALLYFDLDGFKAVNDDLGHDMGDRLLRQVSERLMSCVRETDFVARLGGDEFAMIAENLERIEDVETVAAKILERVSEPYHLGSEDDRAQIGVSIGICGFSGHDDRPEILVPRADRAMYRAKKEGKGAYRVYDPEVDEVAA